ncbi:tyrosine-type recombinase/integrase [Rubrobacter calidifluminis]|uniref:tyrosine-type recombinase/integrase n=1 Tax=Rubrobacter calidifluminis TaxID=1392640 RepID=UPI002360008C|nr:tyrosine-type recombinase/integrase [Rubrobacter calidifluminis]
MAGIEKNEDGTSLTGVPVDEIILPERLPLDENPVSAYLASLSENSRRPVRTSLETVASFLSGGRASAMELAWWKIGYQHMTLVRSAVAGAYAPSTANLMLSAVRGVLRACFRLGYISADELQRAIDVPPVRGRRLPPGRAIERGELYALFRVCYTDNKKARGARDAALFALLYVCGLRRSEAVALDLSDYDPETLEVRVRGKGNKERLVYAEGGADRVIDAWIELRGDGEGALLLPVNKGGRIIYEREDVGGERRPARMSDQAVYDIVRRRQREAGVKKLSPHDFRKTFIGDLLDAIGDLSAAQQLAGHADPGTTARYDRRGERAKRKAASHLHVPYFEENR